MNYTRISLLISVFFHLFLAGLFLIIKIEKGPDSEKVEYIDLQMEIKMPEQPEPEEIIPPAPVQPVEEEKRIIPVEHPQMEEEPPRQREEEQPEPPDPKNSILFIPKTRDDSLKLWAEDLKDYFDSKHLVPQGFDVYSFLEIDPKKMLDSIQKNIDHDQKLRETFARSLTEMKEFKGGVDAHAKVKEYLFRRQGGVQTAPVTLLIAAAGTLAKKLINMIFSSNEKREINRDISVFEIYIMKIVWRNGFAFPSMVYNEIKVRDKPLFTQFKEAMNFLEGKGLLSSIMDNSINERVYVPTVEKQDIVEYFLARLGDINLKLKEDLIEERRKRLYEQQKAVIKQKTMLLLQE